MELRCAARKGAGLMAAAGAAVAVAGAAGDTVGDRVGDSAAGGAAPWQPAINPAASRPPPRTSSSRRDQRCVDNFEEVNRGSADIINLVFCTPALAGGGHCAATGSTLRHGRGAGCGGTAPPDRHAAAAGAGAEDYTGGTARRHPYRRLYAQNAYGADFAPRACGADGGRRPAARHHHRGCPRHAPAADGGRTGRQSWALLRMPATRS